MFVLCRLKQMLATCKLHRAKMTSRGISRNVIKMDIACQKIALVFDIIDSRTELKEKKNLEHSSELFFGSD